MVRDPTRRNAVGMASEVHVRHRHRPAVDGAVARDRGARAPDLPEADLLRSLRPSRRARHWRTKGRPSEVRGPQGFMAHAYCRRQTSPNRTFLRAIRTPSNIRTRAASASASSRERATRCGHPIPILSRRRAIRPAPRSSTGNPLEFSGFEQDSIRHLRRDPVLDRTIEYVALPMVSLPARTDVDRSRPSVLACLDMPSRIRFLLSPVVDGRSASRDWTAEGTLTGDGRRDRLSPT